jgi:hypothetical protein
MEIGSWDKLLEWTCLCVKILAQDVASGELVPKLGDVSNIRYLCN